MGNTFCAVRKWQCSKHDISIIFCQRLYTWEMTEHAMNGRGITMSNWNKNVFGMAIANFVRPIFICTMIRLRQFDSFTFKQNGLIPLLYNIFESTLAKINQYKVTSILFNPFTSNFTISILCWVKKKEIDPNFFFGKSWSDLVLVSLIRM